MELRPVVIDHVVGLLPYASNTTLLAVTTEGIKVVYKPDRGERPLWDFPLGSLGSREVLAYEAAVAMGRDDLVPPTWVADGPLGRGSAQLFIDEDFDFDASSLVRREISEWTWSVAVLDVVANNADRKFGHMIRDATTGGLWAIDHGLTFHATPKLRTVMWGLSGSPLPDRQCAELRSLEIATEQWLAARIEDLLTSSEADAFVERVGSLAAAPFHPHPPTDRPAIPWPIY